MKTWNNLLVLIIILVILIVGGVISVYSAHLKDEQLRNQILTETRLAAAGINFDTILNFSATDADLTNSEYIAMKEKMTRVKAAEPMSRFVYVMGQRDNGSVFFYVDSEEPGTSGYSPPGQDYTEVSDEVLSIFSSGKDGIYGPTEDRWGTWTSGLLPIKNEETGELIGVFGIDIDAHNWRLYTAYTAVPALGVSFLLIVILLSFLIINRRKEEENRRLALSEEAYRESEKKYRTLFDSSADPVFILDPEGIILDVNEVGIEKFGYSREELQVRKLKDIEAFGNKQVDEERDPSDNEPFIYELSLRSRYGQEIPVELNTRSILYEGKPAKLAVVRDITDRKKAERDLKESEARLQAIIDGTPALQFVIDKDHRVVSWNKAMEKYSGIAASSVIGTKNHWRGFFIEQRPLIADLLVDNQVDQLPIWYHDKYHPSDLIQGAYEVTDYYPAMGSGYWLYVLSAPIKNVEGEVTGALETVVDVTERHLAEDAVKEAVKKLNLLSSVTRHDIMNKITMLHGLMMLISDTKKNDPEITEYLALGKQAITAIQGQIEFTRTYQDIGMKKPEWNDCADLIQKAWFDLHTKNATLSVELTGLFIYADPLIRKVFYNLMENSIRHGERVKQIRISCRTSEDDLVLIYEDDGCGIPDADKALVFEKGFGKNTGLGMFLAREILSITHILITEKGEFQKGVLFEITIPRGMFRFSGEAGSNPPSDLPQ